MQKYYRILLFFLILFTGLNAQEDPEAGYHIKTVVIDAGHGGKDPGAVGSKSKEKDIVLSIALKVGEYIKKNFPKTKVIYTRDKDVFVKIHERSKIANDNNADVFISIHANAAANKSASGTETFVMGTKYLSKNKEYMAKENNVIFLEEDYEQNYQLDVQTPQAQIMLSMMQAAYLDNSIRFAEKIEHQFEKRVGRKSRGVHQSVLHVLYNTRCPSVLVETGFISNPTEEKYLISEQGQTYLASGIYRAFRDYKLQSEGWSLAEIDSLVKVQQEKGTALPDGPVSDEESSAKKTKKKEDYKVVEDNKKQKETTKEEAKKKDEEEKKESKKSKNKELNVYFSVQLTSSSDQVSLEDKLFENASDVFEYQQGGWYKYASGKFATFEEAFKQKQALKAAGFEGVFVIAFEQDKRISIQEAKEKLK